MQAGTNLDNYVSVIYDAWSLEIRRKDIMHGGNQKNPRHGLAHPLCIISVLSVKCWDFILSVTLIVSLYS